MDALATAEIRELTLDDELNSMRAGRRRTFSRSALLICISTSPARGQRAASGYATPVVATRGLLAADNYARRDSGYASGFSIAAPVLAARAAVAYVDEHGNKQDRELHLPPSLRT